MSFSAEWLALRAPADDAARDPALLAAAAAWINRRPSPRILDLGSGTGATRRAFGDRVPGAAWWLTDSDARLLEAARGPDTTPLLVDLATGLDTAFATGPDLVTASAFFDLAGSAWIDALVARLVAGNAALYAALTYDGHEIWSPPHPEDAAVAAAFAADMARDKGLGPALGGKATAYLEAGLRRAGYSVETKSSPWRLEAPRDAALIATLADGTATATGASSTWRTARQAAQRVQIGHLDLLATPPG